MPIKFAAFIMTYERPVEVARMIERLMGQSFPPQKILVVDNSSSLATEELINSLRCSYLEYYRVGYNSGPAGAAKIGLMRLTEEGYDWIYWGDDNDPPNDQESFKTIFELMERVKGSYVPIGILGKIGGRINRLTGRTLNLQNRELDGIVEADYIAGGKLMVVNSAVVKKGVLPTEKLFFGFEELGFCLMAKQEGFKVVFDGAALLKGRIRNGHTSPSYRWRGKTIGDSKKLWRQYYSTRNLLYVLRFNKLWLALIFNIFRAMVKGIYGFRYGWRYGRKLLIVQYMAIFHFLSNRFGRADLSRILD